MKRNLTPQEKRTVRLGAIALGIYLVLFAGVSVFQGLEQRRVNYNGQVAEAQALRDTIHLYKEKADLVKDLMSRFQLDPGSLARTSLVAQASAALQKAATESGVNPGAIHETTARGSSHEVAGIQFEGSGQVSGIMSFLYRLDSLGYPLMIESMQITSPTPGGGTGGMGGPASGGALKLTLTIAILDFDNWPVGKEKKPNA